MPIAITQDNFEKEVMKSELPVILDIYASWCGPCQQMTPIIEALEKEIGSHYTFAKLNVDEARELAIKFGITSVPTFMFIKNGSIVGKETGYMSKEKLMQRITTLLS